MAIISRTDATALMPEDVTRTIIAGIPGASAVMSLATRLPNMSRAQQRIPVLSTLPQAYFVTGDTGLKQSTRAAWDNKYLNAEELAVVLPIPENVMADADYPIWDQVRPWIVSAMGAAFDAAVLFGTNAPSSWPSSINVGAAAASQTYSVAAPVTGNGQTDQDYYDFILGPNGINAMVEADGFMVTGHVMAMNMKSRLRGLRDSNGQPIFMTSLQDRTRYALDGADVEFPVNGAMDAATALDFAGDWKQLVYAMRQDITFKVFTEGVVTDGAGNVILNLMQQDAVAIRVVMRLAWQVPNPINQLQATEASRYPFAVLRV